MDLNLSVDAIRFIRETNLRKVCIRISLEYKPPVCTSSFCRKRPYISVNITDEDSIGEGYVRIVSEPKIPVYFADPLFELANREGRSLRIETRGIWKFKRLVLEGLDPYKI